MTKPYPEQHAEKHSIVRELFINTADDNYINARCCFNEGLHADFFWLSVHALEKYMKAILLMNGRSSKSYSHDIVKLYPQIRALAPELLPTKLIKPDDAMPEDYWHDEEVDAFIKRLYRDGQADNRYQLYGYSRRADDLWKIDQLIFNVRRLCRSLEVHFLGERKIGVPNDSVRQRLLKDQPSAWALHCKLEATIEGKRGDVLQHALLNWNHAFAPSDYQHTPADYVYASSNSVLIRRIFEPLEGGSGNFAEADKLWSWIKANIQLPGRDPNNLVAEIEAERDRIKAKFQLPIPAAATRSSGGQPAIRPFWRHVLQLFRFIR
jgi:HEPN domain-containing protein